MAYKIQIRNGTAAEWTAANPTLSQGELGIETDTGLLKVGNGSTSWNSLSYGWTPETPSLLVTSSKTLALTDNYTMQKCLSASAIVITIPTNVSVSFPINSEISIIRYGAGAVTLATSEGVILYSSLSKKSITNQYEAATLKKIAIDEWILIGSLSL